ncbi:hypothetical protein FBQ82_07455 [Anaerolineae bacterium CFX7]|nr:hypothetical protein [Anaerolineae bacterium CFX7]
MEPIFLIVIAALILGLVAYWFSQRQRSPTPSNGGSNSESSVFEFESDRSGVAIPLTPRKLRLVVPNQRERRLEVQALPWPSNVPSVLEKKEQPSARVVTRVLNPLIRSSDGSEIIVFDPPLTLTVFYTKEDADQASKSENGVPQLSLFTYYEADGIRWERLKTQVDPSAMTLTATLTTLNPQDPILIGIP